MSDVVEEIKRQEERERLPFIAPQDFWIDYEVKADGTRKEVEWVRWIKKGTSNPATTEEKVIRLQRDPTNLIWQVLEPYYKRWKENQSAPVDGTPLAAWPGATPQLVKALEGVNIRSVEDLTMMEDSAISRVSIPGLREKQKLARAFLEAQKSTAGVASENAKLKETVESQAKELAELRQLVTDLAARDGVKVVEEPKRGPGRPRKSTVEQAA